MKLLLRLFPAMLMVVAISVAGCGDKDKDSGSSDSDSDAASDKKDDAASMAPPAETFVAMKVSLPKMDWT